MYYSGHIKMEQHIGVISGGIIALPPHPSEITPMSCSVPVCPI